jgi:SAM-dependent methyltransferase
MTEFTCNICGARNRVPAAQLGRELASCDRCGSSVRTRSLLRALSLELFGVSLTLPEFPRVCSLRGLGMSDPSQYANGLAARFDYRNTFYDREPRFDIVRPAAEELGKYDFLISSEVFEHVPPPAATAFGNAFRLLKPHGVLLLTVPYSLEPSTTEHFPDLHDFGLARVSDRVLLVNRTRDGQVQVFDNLVFHVGWGEPSLEMRQFTESGLQEMLAGAGFAGVHIHSDDDPAFGIVHKEAWALPIAARKGALALSYDATCDVLREWRDLNLKFHAEMARLDRSLWFRVGRKLRLL